MKSAGSLSSMSIWRSPKSKSLFPIEEETAEKKAMVEGGGGGGGGEGASVCAGKSTPTAVVR